MIPGTYDISIYRGDSYYGPLITLPDLSPFGGPSDLTTAIVTAQIRAAEGATEPLVSFDVEVVDDTTRQVRLTLDAVDTVIANKKGVWDLQVEDSGWVGTPLKGAVTFSGQVTRSDV